MIKFLRGFFFGVVRAEIPSHAFGDEKRFTGFSKFFDETIRPKALLLEEIRIKNLKKLLLGYRLVSLCILVGWLILFFLSDTPTLSVKTVNNLFGSTIAISILLLILPLFFVQNFSDEIKKNFYRELFKFYQFDYYPEGSQRIYDYDDFNILPQYERQNSTTEDLVLGSYKNVSFRFEELLLGVEVSSAKSRKVRTTFDGVVIMLQFNKNFSGRTIVRSDKGMLGNFSLKMSQSRNDMEKVTLEDVEFEKLFEVYSSNQIEARYLLTTSFMERLKKLFDFFGADKVEGSFYNNALLLVFKSRIDLFKVRSIYEPIDVVADSRKVLEEIALIEDLIDELKLDEKTGL